MSNALALAAVTAVLKDQLDNALVDASLNTALGATVNVTALPPDRIDTEAAQGPQLNLYLYRVSPNAGWRNAALPSRHGDGTRLADPPLALDLHYLLSAYGTEDFEAEILLGYAMQQLHERPVLTRDAIRTALGPPSPVDGSILPAAFGALAAADLADQVELVKITPEALGVEELSKLWSAFQASYRPSAAYTASVVLIESRRAKASPLPVLTIGVANTGPAVVTGLVPPFPTLERAVPPAQKTSVYLGETVRLVGHHLAPDAATPVTVELTHPRLALPLTVLVPPAGVSAAEIAFAFNTPANATPPGVYGATVALTQNGTPRRTNTVPLVLAPRIDGIAAATAAPTTTFTVQTTPLVRPEQAASLVVGTREAPAQPHALPTDLLTFRMDDVAAGTHAARLRVDGVESVLVDRTATPPAFLASEQVTV